MTDEEKTAFETLTRSFTRMETLYKLKRSEVATNKQKIALLTAKLATLQKRLENAVELPVKRGDTVYYIFGSSTIQEWTVQEIRLKADGEYFLICGHEGTDDYCPMSSQHFCVCWFTDRAKAKDVLRNRKEKKND